MTDAIEMRKIIGSRLAIARQRAGLSQAQVADRRFQKLKLEDAVLQLMS